MSLTGLKVVEFAGLAPGPFAGLVLADNGASVIRVDRTSSIQLARDILCRGKRSLAVNTKIPSGQRLLRKLICSADVVIDPFRPGVMEKLGLGPEVFLGTKAKGKGLNERLVYARIAGFPRSGQYKDMAGHDINFLALSGILSMLPGPSEKPTFPLNLIADFGGGGLACALGILLALIERGNSGRGQVVNTDMVSGTRYLSSFPLLNSLVSSPIFSYERGHNILDGGAPFYDVYTCKDGGWMSVGCLEPRFFQVFLEVFLNALPKHFFASQGDWGPTAGTHGDRRQWPKLKSFLEKGFLTNTRKYWADVFQGTDACAVAVLTPAEAAELDPSHLPIPAPHPHVSSRTKPTPSRFLSGVNFLAPGQHTQEILQELGLSAGERERLALDGALGVEARAKAKAAAKL